jgi:DNA-binding MarR family transcriptional regulator/tetratricopeptide (TPR) repeat protein
MSLKLSVRQNNLSRELQSLIGMGLVESRSSHILGYQRRRKVYFLTSKGIEMSQEMVKELRSSYVMVRDQKNNLKEWKLGKLIDHLSENLHRKVSHHESIEEILENGEANLRKLLGKEDRPELKGAPIVKEFFGRVEELDFMEKASATKGPVIISIISIAGQGKTTLASKFLDRTGSRYQWIKVGPWLTAEKVVSDIAKVLRDMGSSELAEMMSHGSYLDLNEAVEVLVMNLSSTGLVVVLDDAHLMSDDLVRFFRSIRDHAILKDRPIRIVLTSRERSGVYTRTEAEVNDDIMEIQLDGLDRRSVSDFLSSKGIPDPLHDQFYQKTKGHPMTIALLTNRPDLGADEISTALVRMLEDEIVSQLSKAELTVVEMVSIMDIPIEKELVYELPGITREIVSDLLIKLILREYGNGTVDIHDLLKDAIVPTISPDDLVKYRRNAYEYYSKRIRDGDLLQTIHFALELDMIDRVIDIMSDHGEYLLGRGYPQLVKAVEMMTQRSKDPVVIVKVLLLQADSERYLGNLGKAESLLDEASEMAMAIEEMKGINSQPFLMSRILRRLAEIKGLEGSGRDVVELYLRSLTLVESSGDLPEKARVHRDIGMAYLGLREFERSIIHLRSALSIHEELQDERGVANIRTDLGIVFYRKLELANSLRELFFGLRAAREGGFDRIRNRTLYWIGRLYMTVMQPDEAVPYFRSSLQGFTTTGDTIQSYRALIGLVSSALKSGNNKKAERSISRVRREMRGGMWSLFPWMRIDLSSEIRSLQCHMDLFEAILRSKSDLIRSFIGPHLDHMRSQYESGNIIDAVNSISWALSNDFKGPNNEYLDQLEFEAKRLDDQNVIVAVLFAKATSTHLKKDDAKALLRKALGICSRSEFHEGRKKVVDYLSLRW